MATEDYDVPLPTYSGRLSNDWTSHEARLKAWLRIKGVPTAAREAADILHLSLEPRSQAALLFDFASTAQRHSFDEGVAFMKTHFDSMHRKRLAQGSAQNAMSNRLFRERGKRREYIKDLVGDLELLLLRSGIVDDWEKRQNFIRCFVEYPRALRLLSEKYTYDEVVAEALRWEATIIQRETEEYIRARVVVPPPRPTATRGERPPSSTIPPRSTSPSGAGPSSQRYSGMPTSPASPHGPPVPPQPTPASQAHSPPHHARQSSAPSTIEEATETLNDGLTPNTSSEIERPTAPTPSDEPYPTYSPRTTTPGGYDSITSRRSLSYLSRGPSAFGFNSAQPPNQYEADDYDFEDEPTARAPPRSHSVDFDLRGTNAGRRLRLEDFEHEYFEHESEEQRSESTPPFVSDALHSDDEGAPQRSASALAIGGPGTSNSNGSTKRKARKLVKRPSIARSSRDARSESAASSSPTVSKPGRIRSWFGFPKSGKEKSHDGNVSVLDQDHDGTRPSSRLGLSLRGPWSRSMEMLGRAPSPTHGPEVMGRPAKVRSGAWAKP